MINAYISTPTLVEAGANVRLPNTRAVSRGCTTCNGGWLYHADGSGQFLLTKPGVYRVSFTATVTSAAAGEVSFGINANGERFAGSGMGATLAADGLANLASEVLVVVPCNASITVSVANDSAADVTVNSASLVITRVC